MKQKLLKTMLLLCALIVGSGTMWATEVTYTFTAASWTSANGNWSGSSNGSQLDTKGVQCTKGNTYTVTSPSSYSNISSIVITYGTASKTTTNSTISIKVGDNSAVAKNVAGGSKTNETLTWNYSPNQTGSITMVITPDGASVYIKSVAVTYSSGPSYTITAESNNTSWGTVSLSGSVITASPVDGCSYANPAYTVTEGTATVSQSGDNFTVTPSSNCTVQINFAATSIDGVSLNKTSLSLSSESSTEQLTATVSPNDASFKNVTWSSNNPGVATVSDDGVVYAVAAGSATITARATNGTDDTTDDYTATCEVTVGSVSYAVALADGTADASNWTISPSSATAGQTVTISYTGSRTITSVSAVKKPFGLSTFSFATPELGKSSNLTFTGASTEKPVWFTGKCDTHNTTGTVTYSHVAAGSYDELYFDGQLISRTGYPYPFTLYITDGLGTKADPFVLSFDEGSSDMALTMTSTGEKTWTITLPTSDVEIQVLMPYTVTLADDNSTLTEASGNAGVTLPSRSDIGSYTFAGWSTTNVTEEITEEPVINAAGTYHPTEDITLYPVYTKTEDSIKEVVDVLNREFTDITGTNYSTWSGKIATSSAVYAGNSAGGNSAIQLRSNNSDSGIVTTTSGGKVKKVSITWNDNTATGRTVDVYGKNTAYSAASDLYGTSTQGTKLGSIVCETSTELSISGDYEYIGLCSNSGALYMDEVKITWSSSSSTTYYTSLPRVSLSETTDNSAELTTLNGRTCTINLTRTLKKTDWNTFCVPFSTAIPDGWTVMELSNTAFSAGTLTLDFKTAESIVAGKPYLVKVGESDVVNPTFSGVTIVNSTTTTTTTYADFVPVLNPTQLTGPDKTKLYLSGENTLYYPSTNMTINGFRAYFQLNGLTAGDVASGSARAFVLNFDGETTGISLTPDPSRMGEGSIYTLDGRKVQSATRKGIYIRNGRKVVIK